MYVAFIVVVVVVVVLAVLVIKHFNNTLPSSTRLPKHFGKRFIECSSKTVSTFLLLDYW